MDVDETILLIEPDEVDQKKLFDLLSQHGFGVTPAVNGEDGLARAASWPPGLILLETELPDMDGLEFCRQIRSWSQLPMIVVSGRCQERDVVLALDAGADDYVRKPFGPAELLARVQVAQRRAALQAIRRTLVIGDLELDVERRIITRSGTRLKLTPTEYRLLAYLMQHAGQLLTYPMLFAEICGQQQSNDIQYLRVYINQLRTKIEPDPKQPMYILNELFVGYRFASQ